MFDATIRTGKTKAERLQSRARRDAKGRTDRLPFATLDLAGTMAMVSGLCVTPSIIKSLTPTSSATIARDALPCSFLPPKFPLLKSLPNVSKKIHLRSTIDYNHLRVPDGDLERLMVHPSRLFKSNTETKTLTMSIGLPARQHDSRQ